MPTVSEPVDQEMRAGKAEGLRAWCVRGTIGEATYEASLRILGYDAEERRAMMEAARAEYDEMRRDKVRKG